MPHRSRRRSQARSRNCSLRANILRGSWDRRPAARKARHGQIEAAPEEMDRTRLADEPPPKLLEDGVGPQQDAPESMRVRRIVRGVPGVLFKANRVRVLRWLRPDPDIDREPLERPYHVVIEIGNRSRPQRDRL